MSGIRFPILFLVLVTPVTIPLRRVLQSKAAQGGETAKLFVQVDPAKTDLTPAQEAALAKIAQSKTTVGTQQSNSFRAPRLHSRFCAVALPSSRTR